MGNKIDEIRSICGVSDFCSYLSGDHNFRKEIYPEYKANRIKMERPPVLKEMVSYFKENGAQFVDHLEADDLLGLNQTEETCIVTIDKDLLMIPGWHYNYVNQTWQYVNEHQGLLHFYTQLLVGDPADNIKGAPGIGKVKAGKILDGLVFEEDMYEAVLPYFSCEEELKMTADVLWIQRKGREKYYPPISESKRQEAPADSA